MGTKSRPGVFDCYANAEPDEPMFVLLGRDPSAALLVRIWCLLRRARKGLTGADSKETEAEHCAVDMERWLEAHPRAPMSDAERDAILQRNGLDDAEIGRMHEAMVKSGGAGLK